MVSGVWLYLVPTDSVGFPKLVTEQWPRLQRNVNGAICNLSFSSVVPVDKGSSYMHSLGTMVTSLCYSHSKPC